VPDKPKTISVSNSLRDLADRLESGEAVKWNITMEHLYEEPPRYLYSTLITDSLEINRLRPSHCVITIKYPFPREATNDK
jgi:hypothetical protein